MEDDRASLFLDGRLLASVADFSSRGNGEYLFKVGMPARAPREEDEDSEEETKRRDVKYTGIEDFWFISEAMSEESILEFTGGKRKKISLDSSLHWHRPHPPLTGSVKLWQKMIWSQGKRYSP